jgi:esterase/lipase superfamily enzyme
MLASRAVVASFSLILMGFTTGCSRDSAPDAGSASMMPRNLDTGSTAASQKVGGGPTAVEPGDSGSTSDGGESAEPYATGGQQEWPMSAAPPDESIAAADAPPAAPGDTIQPRMAIKAQGADEGPASAMPAATEPVRGGPSEYEAEQALMATQGYINVDVFYATDRLARPADGIRAREYVRRFYPTAICALTAALAIGLTPLFLKRQLSPLWTWLGAGSTLALALAASYSCYGLWRTAHRGGSVFGPERGQFTLGTCRVSIPKVHQTGEMERPSLLYLEITEDQRKHIVFQQATPLEENEFYASVAKRVAASPKKGAFVFIHGFDNTFEEAVRRTAQIARDLKFKGAPICYSWPSQGNVLKYTVDEANVEWTVPHLRQFLHDLSRRTNADSIHLIAHSMGNRALTAALRSLAGEVRDKPLFREVVLTAPDIDADVFKRDIAPAILGTAERVTLYASSRDEALRWSKKVHGSPRAGDTGRNLVIVPGMDTIDVSAVDTSFLGHSYYSSNESVLTDMVQLLAERRPADQRDRLHATDKNGQRYWVFQPNTRTARPSGAPSR